MTAAIFGLLGVIVGALTNGGVQAITTNSGRRRERRLAARVLVVELGIFQAGVTAAIKNSSGRPLTSARRAVDAWQAHHSALNDLTYDDWRKVHAAIWALAEFDDLKEFADRPAALDAKTVQNLREFDKHIEEAMAVLNAIAKEGQLKRAS